MRVNTDVTSSSRADSQHASISRRPTPSPWTCSATARQRISARFSQKTCKRHTADDPILVVDGDEELADRLVQFGHRAADHQLPVGEEANQLVNAGDITNARGTNGQSRNLQGHLMPGVIETAWILMPLNREQGSYRGARDDRGKLTNAPVKPRLSLNSDRSAIVSDVLRIKDGKPAMETTVIAWPGMRSPRTSRGP